eukprot:scaffold56164_cov61-Phaeocystis_antarctica.AAC.4
MTVSSGLPETQPPPSMGPWKVWMLNLRAKVLCASLGTSFSTRKDAIAPGSTIVGGLYSGRRPVEPSSKNSRRTPVALARVQ